MNNKIMIHHILNQKPKEKSFLSGLLTSIRHSLWLATCVRKKSHRKRIIKARRVLRQCKRTEFREEPGRFFAYIRKIDPFIFEELLLLAFSSRGFKVRHNKRYTGDGGIDGMVIMPDKKRYAIQAKRYQSYINAEHLNNFSMDLKRQGCSGGFFIHSGKSGLGVYQQISPDVTLISGYNLHRLLTEC